LVLFRKHAARYIHGLDGEAQLRVPLLTCNTVAEFDRLVGELSLTPALSHREREHTPLLEGEGQG
ncbi:MAG: hypothetical protein ABI874_08125, partial [Chloroflexota bacterium]